MVVGQEEPVPFYCPRCGGKMYKPVGSSFYWHADSNHPACEITNIPEPARKVAAAGEPLTQQPPEGPSERKHI